MASTDKGFLAFLGILGAAAVAGYVFAPMLFSSMKPESQPAAGSPPAVVAAPQADEKSSRPVQPEKPQETAVAQPAPEAGKTEPAKPGPESWVAPRFDILRVEPDGSAVVAGTAEPGMSVDLMSGDTVIASSETGASGDFAIVLDKPLDAGDYQLTLRLRDAEGSERISEEVATVSVPASGSAGLLAMVAKPGEASRILAQPEAAPQTTEQDTEQDTAAEQTETPAAGSGSEAQTETAEVPAASEETQPVETTAAEPAPPGEVAAALPDLPAASTGLFSSAPEIAGPPSNETAALATAPAGEAAPVIDADVRIDAVEIEGSRIFVAGSATPGLTVRIEADGNAVGEAKADETGRFIVEAEADLAVGDHTIAANLVSPDAGQVLLRAEVPFNRPAGEALAAVAPSEGTASADLAKEPEETPETVNAEPAGQPSTTEAQTSQDAGSKPAGELVLGDLGQLSALREDAFASLEAFTVLAESATPDPLAIAEARTALMEKLEAVADARLAPDGDAALEEMAGAMRAQAAAAIEAIAPVFPKAGAAGELMLPDADQITALREAAQSALTALSTPAEETVAVAEAEAAPVADSGPRTIVQAPLQASPQAVIIRRGDTLWQIARRTYGQGVRYTTIYLANRSQIRNPDRIAPGQVFSVPEKYDEDAEEKHRQRLQEQSGG